MMKISDYFGENVFSKAVMRERLPREVFEEVCSVEQNGGQISMAAADVVISRAGSSTCNEICACGTPCILIPSPNVTNNHQEKNAEVLAQREGAVMILEKDCTAELLYDQIKTLLADTDRRKKMICRLQEMVRMDSTERICDILEELIKP